jgi:glycerophosphoryl diester phosphodiesterase
MPNPVSNPMTMQKSRMRSGLSSKASRPPAQAGAEARAVVLFAILGAAFCLSCAPGPAPGPFPTPFEIIAHRGASAYAPENTIPAFEKALELGVVDVELDIQLSRDDQVILYHDTKLVEKTGHPGTVRSHEAADLLEMEIGSWFDRTHPEVERSFTGTKLTTLAALFERFDDRFYYHVELKSRDLDLAHFALVQIDAYGLGHHVRFTSFIFEQIERAHALAPGIPAGLLVRDAARLRRDAGVADDSAILPLQREKIDLAKASGFDQVAFASEDLSSELVAYAIDAGLEIRAWRIRSDADMERAISLGAYGMTTNWPDHLIRALLEDKRSN